MAPHNGLVHPKEYDWRDSNVALIGSDLDHNLKHKSAETEPAWNNGTIGSQPGLYIWRIEDFEVVPWPKEKYGAFCEGDCYIVLHSYKVGKEGSEVLGHEIFFWLGEKTSQDEAGTAAYKTVELDEFLNGIATQQREVQAAPSDDFLELFQDGIKILKGGVASGFTHVDVNEKKEHAEMLLRVFKQGRKVVVVEVEPHYKSLDEEDVFVFSDKDGKIWIWQGRNCSPAEKLRAAQVASEMNAHADVEVLSQLESRSRVIVDLLGGRDTPVDTEGGGFKSSRPIAARKQEGAGGSAQLFRLSDAEGDLKFDKVKEGSVSRSDLNGNDVFVLDLGKQVWVWKGASASQKERQAWLTVVSSYIKGLHDEEGYLKTLGTVAEGHESPAFLKALEA